MIVILSPYGVLLDTLMYNSHSGISIKQSSSRDPMSEEFLGTLNSQHKRSLENPYNQHCFNVISVVSLSFKG